MTIKFSSPSGDGLVLKNEKNKCKNLKIFVPAWGWVGSIFSPCKNQLVYVFSSPSGDGLVPYRIQLFQHIMLFSSPLGDGLVPVEGNKVGHNGGIFVPEWGWVGSQQSVCLPL